MKTFIAVIALLIGTGLGFRAGIVTEYVTHAYQTSQSTHAPYARILNARVYLTVPLQGAN